MKEIKMKNRIFTLITILALASMFVSCNDGGGSSKTTSVVELEDITLTTGESTVCTNVTPFTVTPTSDPTVVFSTDAQTGDTTISLESGSVLVQNCTVK